MNIHMGSHIFYDVQIPLLWGGRAIVTDEQGRVSVIDLTGEQANLEILANEPAPGIDFRPHDYGIAILHGGKEEYAFDKELVSFRDLRGALPTCRVEEERITVGTNIFSNSVVIGFAVGLAVDEDSISMGSPMPEGLARLAV